MNAERQNVFVANSASEREPAHFAAGRECLFSVGFANSRLPAGTRCPCCSPAPGSGDAVADRFENFAYHRGQRSTVPPGGMVDLPRELTIERYHEPRLPRAISGRRR